MCLLKLPIFFKKQHFWIFEKSCIFKGYKWVSKNHLSCTKNLSVKSDKTSRWPRPCLKAVPALTCYFGQKNKHSRNFHSSNICNEGKQINKNYILFCRTFICDRESKIWNWPCLLLQNVWSNGLFFKNNILESLRTQIFTVEA